MLPTTAFHTPSTAHAGEQVDIVVLPQDEYGFLPSLLCQRNCHEQASLLISSSCQMSKRTARVLCLKKVCSPRTQRCTNGKPLIRSGKRERLPFARADSRLLFNT